MVYCQVLDISTSPAKDGKLDLSKNRLETFRYVVNNIRNYNQVQFHRLLQGNNQYRFLINQVELDNSTLLQLFHHIPPNEDITSVNLSGNNIIYFPHQMIPENINHLNLSKNNIQDTGPLAQHLASLKYSHNPIRGLPLELPPNLLKLSISHTDIEELPNLPVTLTQLSIRHTQLRRLPDNFLELENLINFKMDGNPQLEITEVELAFLERIFEARRIAEAAEAARLGARLERDDNRRDIYHDGQNVHDSKVNKDVLSVVEYLLRMLCHICGKQTFLQHNHNKCLDYNIKQFSKSITNKDNLDYLMVEVGDVTFHDYQMNLIFYAYFNHLLSFPTETQKEILTILNKDLPEMRFVCITGRVARLMNTLSGFDDKVEIQITDNDQIKAKYNIISKKYADDDPITKNILRAWEFYNLLVEILVADDAIQVWLEPFWEELEEKVNLIERVKDKSKLSPSEMATQRRLKKVLGDNFDDCLVWIHGNVEKYIEENGED